MDVILSKAKDLFLPAATHKKILRYAQDDMVCYALGRKSDIARGEHLLAMRLSAVVKKML